MQKREVDAKDHKIIPKMATAHMQKLAPEQSTYLLRHWERDEANVCG